MVNHLPKASTKLCCCCPWCQTVQQYQIDRHKASPSNDGHIIISHHHHLSSSSTTYQHGMHWDMAASSAGQGITSTQANVQASYSYHTPGRVWVKRQVHALVVIHPDFFCLLKTPECDGKESSWWSASLTLAWVFLFTNCPDSNQRLGSLRRVP